MWLGSIWRQYGPSWSDVGAHAMLGTLIDGTIMGPGDGTLDCGAVLGSGNGTLGGGNLVEYIVGRDVASIFCRFLWPGIVHPQLVKGVLDLDF